MAINVDDKVCATTFVPMAKLTDAAPSGTVTCAGTIAFELLVPILTTTPPAGATPLNTTVAPADADPTTVVTSK